MGGLESFHADLVELENHEDCPEDRLQGVLNHAVIIIIECRADTVPD